MIVDLDIKDKASITAVIHEGNMAGGTYGDWASYINKYSADNNPEWGVDPATGIHYLRCGSDATHGTRIISWFLNFDFIKQAPREELYVRYLLWPEEDVNTGMNELGVKLPGIGSTATKETLSLRMEHGKMLATPGQYPFVSYWYDAESGSGFGEVLPMGNGIIKVGQWNCIEQHVKLNTVTTTANKDGSGDVWLNDELVWSTNAKRWRWFVDTLLNQVHINIYHGGTTPPKGPIHYRIAKIAISDTKIGLPQELVTKENDDMATQAELDDLVAKCKAAYDAAVSVAGSTVPDQQATIDALNAQLATMTAARDAALQRLATLNADIDAAQAKD